MAKSPGGAVTLMILGPIVFDLTTPNLVDFEKTIRRAFAKHEIVNGSPVYEGMGPDESRFTLNGTLHPINFDKGDTSTLDLIEAVQSAELPLPLMRGDYKPLGIVLIEDFTHTHTELWFDGKPRMVDLSLELIAVDPKRMVAAAADVLRLFG